MIFLRCMSFLIGSLIVMGAPFFLLPDTPQGPRDVSGALAGCLAIALAAAGFCFVGVAGNHMKRSRLTRALGAVLLAFPIAGSVWVLNLDNLPEDVWMIGPLLFFAVSLFYCFIFPGRRTRLHPPLRPRDSDAIAKA
jgi:O-antigen/teichoic acid export membrane protein